MNSAANLSEMCGRTFHRSTLRLRNAWVIRRKNRKHYSSVSSLHRTKPGEIVLDPFCGCGTTIHAAQKLDRQWIGIDITYLAINLIKRRLKDAFGEEIEFEEKGQPTDFESAKRLAELDKFQFQHWALSLIGARPLKEGEGKGADRGVDGLLYYYETERKDIPAV